MSGQPCFCGSGLGFEACCGPILSGERNAPTAEALMRSRYTAFARKDWAYLARTQTAPFEAGGDDIDWLGLEVMATRAGGAEDVEGWVEFVARYRLPQGEGRLHEISRFVKREGCWLYVDGEFPKTSKPVKTGRNDPCPCGSGKKYKKCCGSA